MNLPPEIEAAQFAIRTLEGLPDSSVASLLHPSAFPRDVAAILVYGLGLPILRSPELTLVSAERCLCKLSGFTAPEDEGCSNGGEGDSPPATGKGATPEDAEADRALDVPKPVRLADAAADNADAAPRALLGLLHLGPPFNAVFLQDGLPSHIERYVLAHELGHFIIDILSVQRLWERSLPQCVDAITRAFEWRELEPLLTLQAALKGLPRRPPAIYASSSGSAASGSHREIRADLFARELLAPWEEACGRFIPDRRAFAERLREEFDLPMRIGAAYHGHIKRYLFPEPDLFDRLFSPLIARS